MGNKTVIKATTYPIDTLPEDDRWFLGFYPEYSSPTAPWVIATRGDHGFFDEEGYPVAPTRWAEIPDPQPAGSGWTRPVGSIQISCGKIRETVWIGFIVRPDGSEDTARSVFMDESEEVVLDWARAYSDKYGLPIKRPKAVSGDNAISFPGGDRK